MFIKLDSQLLKKSNMATETPSPTPTTPLLSSSDGAPATIVQMSSMLPRMVAMVILFNFAVVAYSYHVKIYSSRQALLLAVTPVLQAVWASLVIRLGKQGIFATDSFLHSMPILWFPMITVSLQMSMFSFEMDAVFRMLDTLPIQVFVTLQAIRSLAIGSLLKWRKGLFPTVFAWGTAFPDMLFGLSALALLVQNRWIHDQLFLVWWNLIGFVIIVPSGITMLQLGMKPTQLYQSTVSNNVVFAYPMVLAPGIVVPMLVSWNAIVAMWAWTRTSSS